MRKQIEALVDELLGCETSPFTSKDSRTAFGIVRERLEEILDSTETTIAVPRPLLERQLERARAAVSISVATGLGHFVTQESADVAELEALLAP